jgi:hypothetical protein
VARKKMLHMPLRMQSTMPGKPLRTHMYNSIAAQVSGYKLERRSTAGYLVQHEEQCEALAN